MNTLDQIHAELVSIRRLLQYSLPVAKEPAPPVPESLARTLASDRSPRFFKHDGSPMLWVWRNGVMTIGGEKSSYSSPADILSEPGVYETDEHGNPLELSAADIAAEKADREKNID